MESRWLEWGGRAAEAATDGRDRTSTAGSSGIAVVDTSAPVALMSHRLMRSGANSAFAASPVEPTGSFALIFRRCSSVFRAETEYLAASSTEGAAASPASADEWPATPFRRCAASARTLPEPDGEAPLMCRSPMSLMSVTFFRCSRSCA